MSNHAVANRYAVALFELAKEQGMLEQVAEELEATKRIIAETPSFLLMLKHPKVDSSNKTQWIIESFQGFSQTVKNTLLLLLERKRIDILEPMIASFQALHDDSRNIGRATVSSVKPLSEQESKLISESFAKKVGKDTLVIENAVDPTLVGGIKIRIGDMIFDASVKGQLDRLERKLVSGKR